MDRLDVRVTRARRVFGDGRHNAFTGICAFDGRQYVVFRSGESHVSDGGVVTLLGEPATEGDAGGGREWPVRARIDWRAGYDLRDPGVVVADGELLIYCGAARASDRTETVSLLARSADGERVAGPEPVEGIPTGYWLWDVTAHDGLLYGAAYAVDGETTRLYRSERGERWEHLADVPDGGSEVSLDVGPEGRLWALVRGAAGPSPALCVADPPYDSFERLRVLPMRFQGPLVKRLEGGCVVVGRSYELGEHGKHNISTDVWWCPDGRDHQFVRSLPSGGDTSYADWLDVAPGRAVLSYYSAHAYGMDLPHEENHRFEENRAYAEHTNPADVYLADVSYPAQAAE